MGLKTYKNDRKTQSELAGEGFQRACSFSYSLAGVQIKNARDQQAVLLGTGFWHAVPFLFKRNPLVSFVASNSLVISEIHHPTLDLPTKTLRPCWKWTPALSPSMLAPPMRWNEGISLQ